jgi:hypothetical protein
MVSTRRKLQLIASFGVLVFMAVAAACNGFFVDPVLQGITVSSLQSTTLTSVGNTAQLLASGTYDDGSKKNLTGLVTWSVTPTGFVTLSTTTPGLVTATKVTNPGTAVNVQAAEASSSGTVITGTVTITAGASSNLIVTSSPATPISLTSAPSGTTVIFTATLNGTNVTAKTTFTSSNSAIINITVPSSGTGDMGGTTGTVTITGSDAVDSASGSTSIVVTN